jgi:hypothetical protein
MLVLMLLLLLVLLLLLPLLLVVRVAEEGMKIWSLLAATGFSVFLLWCVLSFLIDSLIPPPTDG